MTLDELLERVVAACFEVFGRERVEAIVAHGSAIKGGVIRGYSDVDFMVFLAPGCFGEDGELADEDTFGFQERFGALPWRGAGFLNGQVYFYDARRLPDWWTGPAPDSYRELWGRLPAEVRPTPERLREIESRFLREELPRQLAAMLRTFVDTADGSLPRRVRLLGTTVTPVVFAVLSLDEDDLLELWALPKQEALARLEARYPGEAGPRHARRFYEGVTRLFGEAFEPALARTTFAEGVRFLRWAHRLAAGTGDAT
jgi:hypothetical protein